MRIGVRRNFVKPVARIALGLLVSAVTVVACAADSQGSPATELPQLTYSASSADSFARVDRPIPLTFPADQGDHPDYASEWWYYTGNLGTQDGRRFGYQLTFFRRSLVPTSQRQARVSDLASNQVYMAHFTLTDVGDQTFRAFEKFSRGAAGLAGAQASPFRAWLEDWQVGAKTPNTYGLKASSGSQRLDLLLNDSKGPVLQGQNGYSPKGPNPGDASMYYSLTHLITTGNIQIDNTVYPVNGLSWMDHEFSTSALAPDQVGWDWFALQLDDNSELMLFHLRRSDGTIDPYSSGTLIERDARTSHLNLSQFMIASTGTWKSPHSLATYPSGWKITIPGSNISLNVEPLVADQELNVSFTYWEGAVRITGVKGNQPVTGFGYVELVGYAGSIAGQF
jgi:predicted secreted hydrolase